MPRGRVRRSVELSEAHEAWLHQLMELRLDLNFADVVRYCFEFAMELDPDAEIAAETIPGLRRG